MSLEPWPSATSILRPLAQRTSAPERCASPSPLAESLPPRWWPIAVWSIWKRSSSPSVCAKSRAVTSTSSPRARSTSITGRMTSTCGELVRSIQTRKDGAGYLAQVFRRVGVRAAMRKTLLAGLAARRLARRRVHRLRRRLGPRRLRHGPPGRHDVHRRCAVHRELHLHRRRRHGLHRPGRPLLGHRRPDRHRRLPDPEPARTARRSRSPAPPSPARWSTTRWTAMQAAGETDADTCAYNDIALIKPRPGRLRQGQPVGPDARRPDRPRRHDRDRRHRLHVRQLLAAPGHHAALAQARQEPRRLGRRLDAPRLHRLARHPGRLGLRLHGRSGQRVRRPLARSSSPRSPPPTASRTCARCCQYMRSHGGPDVTLAAGTEPFTGSIIG